VSVFYPGDPEWGKGGSLPDHVRPFPHQGPSLEQETYLFPFIVYAILGIMAGSHYRGNAVDDPVVWKSSGNKFFKKGLYGIALRFYARAIQLNPDFIEAWNNIGLSFLKLGRVDEARRCNEKVKELRMRSGNPLDPVGSATRVRTAASGSLLNDNFWYALCIAVLVGISLTILTFDPGSTGPFQALAFIWGLSLMWFVIAYLLLQYVFHRPK